MKKTIIICLSIFSSIIFVTSAAAQGQLIQNSIIENKEDIVWRKKLLRDFSYKLWID